MTTTPYRIEGRTFNAQRGWNRVAPELGFHYRNARDGIRLVAGKHAVTLTVGIFNRVFLVKMQPRGVCTIRSTTQNVDELEVPGLGSEDFRGGSASGIDPFGIPGTIHDHDATMRRCPVELLDMATGVPLRIQSPGYNLVRFAQVAGYDMGTGRKCYDGQHLVRAVRFAVRFLRDPWVRMDLRALARDAGLAWSSNWVKAILAMPGGRGHGACGREWAWVAYVAALAGDRALSARMTKIAQHVAQPWGGLLRNVEGSYWGSPHPWAPSEQGGSGVPHGVDVAQDFELSFQVLALQRLGQQRMAMKLANSVLQRPLRKWIDCDTVAGVGNHYADIHQRWIGLGALAEMDRAKGIAYAKTCPVPTQGGSQVGPFAKLADTRVALIAWGQPGKTRAFIDATA